MGYETRMYFGEFGVPRWADETYLVCKQETEQMAHGEVFRVWPDKEDPKRQIFYINGNFMKYVDQMTPGTFELVTFKTSFFIEVGMIDLCKCSYGLLGNLIAQSHSKEPDCPYPRVALWGRQDSIMIEDSYGDPLRAMPASDFLKAMIEDNKKEKYRRFEIAIGTLKPFIRTFGKKNAMVVCYGY